MTQTCQSIPFPVLHEGAPPPNLFWYFVSLATPSNNFYTQENKSISHQDPEAGPAPAFLQPHPSHQQAGEAGAPGWGGHWGGHWHSWNVSFNRTNGD